MSRSDSSESADTAAAAVREAIAINLKRWRLVRGLSNRELAQRAGVSPALVSQIERAAANCTIDVISRIADALGLSFADLTWRFVAQPQLVRADEGDVLVDRDARVRTLFDSTDRRRFEIAVGTVAPGGQNSAVAHGIGSVEYVFVVAGSVDVATDQWRHRLERGDSLRFSGEDVHQYHAGPQGAELLTLVSSTDESAEIDSLSHIDR